MFTKLHLRLAVIYGLIMIFAITSLDIILIYSYHKSQYDKYESSHFSIGAFMADLVAENMTNITVFSSLADMYGQSAEGRILILDNNSLVLADSRKSYENDKITNRQIRNALAGKKTAGYYRIKGKKLLMVAVPVSYGKKTMGAVLISAYVDKIDGDIAVFRNKVIGISLLIVIAVCLLSYITGKGISTPVEKLTRASEHMANGNLNTRVEVRRNDEIGRLAHSFNVMSHELQKIDTNRRRFVSDVTHELKTPLASIKTLIESLIDSKNDEATYKEYLTDVNTEIDRLSGLVTSLLTLTRLEEVQLKKETICVKTEVDYVMRFLTPLAEEKKITIENQCGKSFNIGADKERFREILINLLDNAIKYGRDGGCVKVYCYISDGKTFVKVSDNGFGIPESAIPYIFDNFYRVDESRTRKKGGSGIGLYIVKRIVMLHGWDISVESKVGQGTEFVLHI